jgi:osmotically-inducible protein OsmY
MRSKAHGRRGTARGGAPPTFMRLLLPITAAILVAACERAPTSLSTRSTDVAPVASGSSAPAASPATAKAPATQGARMPPVEALTDAAITGRIQRALVADPGMAGADVSVNTDNGVVVLAGTVKSHEQTGIASAHAQRQDGVLRVDNHLRPEIS